VRILTGMTMFGTLVALAATAAGRPPDDGAGPGAGSGAANTVSRMMRFDKNQDGKLTKAEVTDQRLHRLFDQADVDKDGAVTKAELTTLASKWQERQGNGPPGFGPPGGFPPPGGGMMGGPPRPGEILPAMLRRNLKLTAEQAKQIDDLQKEVDEKIGKILNNDQKEQLKAMRQRGPGMFGGPGGRPPDFGRRGRQGGPPDGPGGFGPPGGRPPDRQEPPPPPPDEQ
jgi:EF hand